MDHLPEPLQTILTNATTTYLRSAAHSQLTTHLSTLRTTIVDPYLLTPLSHFLASMVGTSSSSSGSMPDLMTALMLAGVLFASLVVLDYLRRFVIWWVMWWVRLIVRVVFWGSVLVVGVWVWNVGVEQAIQDAGRMGGFVMGFVEEVRGMLEGGSGGSGNGKGNGWW